MTAPTDHWRRSSKFDDEVWLLIAQGVRDRLAEGDGFWKSCSGCTETEEPHSRVVSLKFLTALLALLPPRPVEVEGQRYEYQDPNAAERLNELRGVFDAMLAASPLYAPPAAPGDAVERAQVFQCVRDQGVSHKEAMRITDALLAMREVKESDGEVGSSVQSLGDNPNPAPSRSEQGLATPDTTGTAEATTHGEVAHVGNVAKSEANPESAPRVGHLPRPSALTGPSPKPSSDSERVFSDATNFGVGYSQDGKHVPLDEVYMKGGDDVEK